VRFWASHEYVNRLWRMHCIIDIKKCHKSVYMCIKHAPIDSSVWSEEKKHWNRNDSNWCLFMYLTKCKIQIATFFLGKRRELYWLLKEHVTFFRNKALHAPGDLHMPHCWMWCMFRQLRKLMSDFILLSTHLLESHI
jgi:hypothetical protein